MDSDAQSTPRRKAAQATKVKVVASRYAQAMQKVNLEAKTDRSGRIAVASSSGNTASIKVSSSSRGASSRGAAQTRTGVVSTGSKAPTVPSTPAVYTTSASTGRSTGGSSTDSTGGSMSISEKLRLYRANKALQKPNDNAPTARLHRSGSATADPLRTVQRPTFPERITPPTEKAPLRPLSRGRYASSNPPAGSAGSTTPIKRRAATPSTNSQPTTPSTIPGGRHTKRSALSASFVSSASTTTTTSSAMRVPTSTTEEELELLECLYLQLCLTEAKAAEAFHRQEQNAERQIITAWNILQSKLQLLHDTSIRLDRELRVRTLEDHLTDQADPFVRLASRIRSFNDDLAVVSRSLEASLQRMPMPGIVCNPHELRRQLDGFTMTLEAFQKQLQSDGMGSTIADALTFTQDMEESTEQICSLLLQVGQLLEEIQLEVNTETSLKAQHIQETRVDKAMDAADWW